MMTLCLLAALTGLQDPAPDKISSLIQRLSDSEIEVRERAKAELFKMGPPVLETLRKHSLSADPAVTAELKSIIAQLEREIMLGEYRGKPSMIRLKADRRPLKEILAKIGEQSRTPIVVDQIPEEDAVSIELDGVPFFEAVDRLCRIHKGLRMKLDIAYPPGEEIPLHGAKLVRGSPGAVFRHVDGQFAVELETLVGVRSSDFKNEDSWFDITLLGAWERGAQPTKAEVVTVSAVDDKGNAYKGQVANAGRSRKMFIPTRHYIRLDPFPPPEVRKFREISGVLVLDFPTDVEILRLPDPAKKTGETVSGKSFTFKLIDFKKVSGGYACVFEVRSAGHGQPAWDRDMRLVDRAGKSYLGEYKRMISSDAAGMTHREIRFEVPAGAEIAELRHTDLIGGKTHRVEWKFKEVPIR